MAAADAGVEYKDLGALASLRSRRLVGILRVETRRLVDPIDSPRRAVLNRDGVHLQTGFGERHGAAVGCQEVFELRERHGHGHAVEDRRVDKVAA